MTVRELYSYLDASSSSPPMLLDVREPWEFQICRLDGAKLIPMRQIPGAANKLEKDREIIVVCHHGIRSRQVALYLERLGFQDVVNLQGGMAAWAADVDASCPTY